MDDPLPEAPATTEPTATTPASERRAGRSTAVQGLGFAALGSIALWVSFRLAGNARAILGAGPLIGGGMVGYGTTQAVLGKRLVALRWIAAVISGLVILGAVIIVLETTLGVTVA